MGRRIGIRLANGAFFDLLPDDEPGSRKLRLSSVRDGQTFFYVELFSSPSGSMADASFLMKVELDGLPPHAAGKYPIDFSIKIDSTRRAEVFLSDAQTGKNACVTSQIPDYSAAPADASGEARPKIVRDKSWRDKINKNYSKKRQARFENEKRQKNFGVAPMVICLICMIVSVSVSILAFCLYKFASSKPVADAPVYEDVSDEISEITQKENEIVVADGKGVLPQKPRKTDQTKNSKRYKIIWGDTLWDIADAHYRNPWLYRKIADFNGIKNPDYIIAGKWILIPAN